MRCTFVDRFEITACPCIFTELHQDYSMWQQPSSTIPVGLHTFYIFARVSCTARQVLKSSVHQNCWVRLVVVVAAVL